MEELEHVTNAELLSKLAGKAAADALVQQFGGAQAGQALGVIVESNDVPGGIERDDAVGNRVEKCAGEIEVFAFKLSRRLGRFCLH